MALTEKVSKYFEKRNTWFIYCACAYLALYAFSVLGEPTELVGRVVDWMSIAINALFALDFAVRWMSSSDKFRFVARNFIELISLALPFVRALRIFRLIVAANAIQRHLGTRQIKAVSNLALSLPLVLFVSSLAILDVEKNVPGSTIDTFAKATWWSFATMATVGDGRLFPITWEGHFVAAALMLIGIGLFGAVAALFASTMVADRPRP